MAEPVFTFDEKLEEVRREITMRERVWADRIARGDKSTLRKMALIRAIEADYVAATTAGRLL